MEDEKLEIKDDPNYEVYYNTETATVHFQGTVRLIGANAYVHFTELLEKVLKREATFPLTAEQKPLITFDLKQLESLNSSGITTLAKFVIKVNQKSHLEMIIQGSRQIAWQKRSLINLKRLMPRLQLEWEE
jgi:hypothetical protein